MIQDAQSKTNPANALNNHRSARVIMMMVLIVMQMVVMMISWWWSNDDYDNDHDFVMMTTVMMISWWWWQWWWFHDGDDNDDNDDDFVRSSAKPTSGWLMRPSIMICLRDNKSLTGIDLQLPILAHPFLMFARYFPLSTHVGGKGYKLLLKSDASTFFDFLPVFICDGGVLGEQVRCSLWPKS